MGYLWDNTTMSKNNEFELQKPLHKRADTVLFDLDGTIADTMKYEKQHKHRHEGFAKEALSVGVNDDMVQKMHKAKANGDNVVILTARSAHYREETKQWLHKNQIPYDALVMRPTDNQQKDKKVKRELLEEDILPKFDVEKAYDDKKKNRKMFEKLGIDAKGVK
jgi:beta-phosphoglucomutase-like phosphatase (HAD superfamily)